KTSNKYCVLFIYLALALTTLVVFQQLRNYDFVNYDDPSYVSKNPQVQAGLARDSIAWAFTTGYESNWHPLTWLSHMLDCQLFGTNPGWHHLTNLLLHIANTLLLFAVLKRMTGALWRSAFVAAAFALHPLHVESVAWISERKDVLSTFFWMLTMWAYVRYTEHPKPIRYLLTVVFFVLGLMAKPMLVTLPFVLLLLDYWPLGRFQPGKDVKPVNTHSQSQASYYLVWEKIPFFIISLISSAVTFLVQQSGGAVKKFDAVPLIIRIANAFISYLTYIGKMIWPSRLAVFYPHPGDKLAMWQAATAALLLLVISIWIIRLAPKRRYLLVGWLWYLGTLVPVIGLVQVGVQALADRYTYVPLTGLFIIIAWGFGDLAVKWRYRKILYSASMLTVLLALAICTHLQLRHWRNGVTLFEHAIEVTNNNHIAHNNLGVLLKSQGNLNEAISHYHQALQIKSDFAKAHYNLGGALRLQGKLDEAISHYRQALQARPNYAKAHNNLGIALRAQGKLDEAIHHYHQALQIKPDDVKTHNNLANALLKQGKFDEAVHHYRQALQVEPDNADIRNNLKAALKSRRSADQTRPIHND
ncbi:MAG: tetratricopeptide repeat protein, partial [Planctomycetota bacterium]